MVFEDLAIFTSGMGPTLVAAIVAVGAVGVAYVFTRGKNLSDLFAKYPVTAHMFERRGNAVVYVNTRKARYNPDEQSYVFKGSNDIVPAQKFKFVIPGNILFLFSPERGQLNPLEIDPATGHATPSFDDSMKYIFAKRIEKNFMRFYAQDQMDKFLPLMIYGVVAVGVMLIIYAAMTYGLAPVLQQTSGAAHELSVALQGVRGCQIPNAVPV